MRNASTLANALARGGMDVRVVTMEGDGSGPSGLDEGIAWTGLNCSRALAGSIRTHTTAGYRLARALSADPPDLLYVVDSWSLPAFRLARFMAPGLRHVPWIYHTFDWMDPGSHPLHEVMEHRACLHADGVVNVDRSRARMQQAIYRLPSMPHVLPNYLSRREKIPLRDEDTRAGLIPGGRSGPDTVLLCYPTVASRARLTMELIDSLPAVDERVCLVTFASDDEYGNGCRRRCAELGVSHRVLFHETVPYSRLLEIVVACDIGAVFHDYRASSGYFMCNPDRVSLFAACGIPFVGSNYPNMEALVYRHQLGACCDPTDPAAIAVTVNQLVSGGAAAIAVLGRRVRDAFEQDLHFEKHEGPWLAYVRQRLRVRPV